MNVAESRRIRHLIMRAERGEELPAALVRALDEAEARAGWVSGFGSLEAAEIAIPDAAGGIMHTRRVETPLVIVGLQGNVALQDGATSVRLFATVAREGELGLETFAGELISARALSLELSVTAFDDLTLGRIPEEHEGRLLLVASPRATAARHAAPSPAAVEPMRPPTPSPSPLPAAPPLATAPAALEVPPALTPPLRPNRARDEVENYPETGDLVSHFHFGECEVLSSDGERIRLRQEKDGRVREVSLTMLKIEQPTVDPATGKRHFRLSRKH